MFTEDVVEDVLELDLEQWREISLGEEWSESVKSKDRVQLGPMCLNGTPLGISDSVIHLAVTGHRIMSNIWELP